MNERELKEEIEKTYELRNITYQRLRVQNFWTRILEIYYSVFTALLSVCSIMLYSSGCNSGLLCKCTKLFRKSTRS